MAGHLDHDKFFLRLAELFSSREDKDHGSIYLVQKRLSYGSIIPSNDSLADLNPTSPLPVIIRATNGKSKRSKNDKIKLSTVVQPEDLEAFFVRYADCCKAGMLGLRKRDRKAKKKDKGKKKKAGGDTTTKS